MPALQWNFKFHFSDFPCRRSRSLTCPGNLLCSNFFQESLCGGEGRWRRQGNEETLLPWPLHSLSSSPTVYCRCQYVVVHILVDGGTLSCTQSTSQSIIHCPGLRSSRFLACRKLSYFASPNWLFWWRSHGTAVEGSTWHFPACHDPLLSSAGRGGEMLGAGRWG